MLTIKGNDMSKNENNNYGKKTEVIDESKVFYPEPVKRKSNDTSSLGVRATDLFNQFDRAQNNSKEIDEIKKMIDKCPRGMLGIIEDVNKDLSNKGGFNAVSGSMGLSSKDFGERLLKKIRQNILQPN